jgi:hypothetical protein
MDAGGRAMQGAMPRRKVRNYRIKSLLPPEEGQDEGIFKTPHPNPLPEGERVESYEFLERIIVGKVSP